MREPYENFYSVGNVNYYYLNFEDSAYPYVGFENVETIKTYKKFLFFKSKEKTVDLPVSFKLLPLNSLLLFTFMNALMLNETTYELDVENNKIPVYSVWDELDLEDLKKSFYEQIIKVTGVSNYSFPKTIKNPVAKGFAKNGFLYLALETHGKLNRTYWMIRTNKFGNTHVVSVAESGEEGDPITSSTQVFFVDRDFIKIVVEDFKKGKFVKKEENLQKIEDIREEE